MDKLFGNSRDLFIVVVYNPLDPWQLLTNLRELVFRLEDFNKSFVSIDVRREQDKPWGLVAIKRLDASDIEEFPIASSVRYIECIGSIRHALIVDHNEGELGGSSGKFT